VSDAAAPDAAAERPSPPPPPAAEPGRHDLELLETRRIVPAAGLPAAAAVGQANNNLDVVRHDDGRVYLAFRTAPDHFASNGVALVVLSSADEQTWSLEGRYTRGTDLREPRLLSFGGTLFLTAAVLGSKAGAFEPQGVVRAEKPPGATLGPLVDLGWPPYIVWRTRIERGRPYMVRYLGGEHIYRFDGQPLAIELLGSADGRAWAPVDATRPAVAQGGGSEADFTFADDGSLLAVIRNEAGDDSGWGSKICHAPPGQPAAWTCTSDPRKFDSPLMFWWDGEAYLVARRNLTPTGNFDLGAGIAPGTDPNARVTRTLANQLDYLQRPKRCSIWRFIPAENRIAFVLDLPSRGDTCFPAWLPGPTPDTVVIYNYSSDLDGPELSWSEGQAAPTFIYRHVLRLRAR
jgi:hypothetical protein